MPSELVGSIVISDKLLQELVDFLVSEDLDPDKMDWEGTIVFLLGRAKEAARSRPRYI
ncbi:hypothetical protein HYV22_03175 [Candidatus Gottesmanbacteria bacterium]|nr:hypothetical protein [Candidatus Gottesmanbacteria bacterium]